MIITITGKPCSGKGEVSRILSDNYGFERISVGNIYRQASLKLAYNNLNKLSISQLKQIDKIVDATIVEIGKARANENLILDSRLAWHFISDSFKVFLDVDWQEAGRRLLNANRQGEQVKNLSDAIQHLKQRWDMENTRYQELYNVDNLHSENYNLVINTTNKTPNEIAEQIYNEYKKFTK